MKTKLIKIALISLVLLGLVMPSAPLGQSGNQVLAEETGMPKNLLQEQPPEELLFEEPEFPIEPSMPGRIEKTGTYFEIKDSKYLNITLESTEEIKIVLESIPRMISMDISSSSKVVSATHLTIGGLGPNKTYYKYQNSYKNGVAFVSDENGSYNWVHDLSQPHHIWIQKMKGTTFIDEDTVLDHDITGSVEITADNITLDCNNHNISGSGLGIGINLPNKHNVGIKNCEVFNFSHGIDLSNSSNNNLTGNNIHHTHFGVYFMNRSSNNTFKNNNINNNTLGLGLWWYGNENNVIDNNNFEENSFSALFLGRSVDNIVVNNTFLTNASGIYFYFFIGAGGNRVFHNNFINNDYQAWGFTNNFVDNGYPDGGNYWSDYTGQDLFSGPNQDQDGSDGIGDTAYEFHLGRDRYPFMKENGWEVPPETEIIEGPSGTIYSNENIVFKWTGSDDITPTSELLYSYYLEDYEGDWSGWTSGTSKTYGQTLPVIGSIDWLPDGDYTFKVKARDQAGNEDPTPAEISFTVATVPTIFEIKRDFDGDGTFEKPITSGAPGITIKLIGINFKKTPLVYQYVYFGCRLIGVHETTNWTDNEIILQVPPCEGSVDVRVEQYNESIGISFTYEKPFIDDIEPQYGKTGTEVEINGENFGYSISADNSVKFGESGSREISWEDNKIITKAPWDYGFGLEEKILGAVIEGVVCYYYGCPKIVKDVKDVIDIISYLVEINKTKIYEENKEIKITVPVIVSTSAGKSNTEQFTYQLSSIIEADLNSPGELRVYDSQGRVVGSMNGEIKEEIPNSVYNEERHSITIFGPSDVYRYEVVGTDQGNYELRITSFENKKVVVFTATNIPTTASTTHQYNIDWEALTQGENGVTLKIDADGDGVFEKTVAADSELTQDGFILQTETVVDCKPDTLNLRSNGKWVTCYIELPEGFDANQIDVSTIMLNNTISALPEPIALGDYNNNGIDDLMVKFDREQVQGLLEIGDSIALTLTGKTLLNQELVDFKGNDVVKVVNKGKK